MLYNEAQALLRAGLFYRVLKAKSRKIKKENARNHQAVADRAGKHSPTQYGFSGNGELVDYRVWKKRKCKHTHKKRKQQKISPKKSCECDEIKSHK